MEGAKACHLLAVVPAVKKTKTPSAVPPPADLICISMAQRTIAELRACQLQRSAHSAYCLACRCLCSHAAPSAVSCKWGSGRAGLGGAGAPVPEGAAELGLTGLCRLRGARVSSGVLPAAVGTFIYQHALSETLVNRTQRREISSVWVQQQQQPPALRRNNEICVTQRFFSLQQFKFFINTTSLFKRQNRFNWANAFPFTMVCVILCTEKD